MDGYYRIKATDGNAYTYYSPSVLVQYRDESPPALPAAFSGTFITDDLVELRWEKGLESDLKGYRIFAANHLEGPYLQITVAAIPDSQFLYRVNTAFGVDSMFFKILATDFRDNYSERSAPIAVARPDLIPPAPPVLFKANPVPAGIQLGFSFSPSADVTRHTLQRKLAYGPDWVDVVDIPKADEDAFAETLTPKQLTPTNYIDIAALEHKEYAYRLVAYDRNDNVSSSELLRVTPYDSGERGEVAELTVRTFYYEPEEFWDPYNLMDSIVEDAYSTYPWPKDKIVRLAGYGVISFDEVKELLEMPDAKGIVWFIEDRQAEYYDKFLGRELHLMWMYNETVGVADFQVYRSVDGGPMVLYNSLLPEESREVIRSYGSSGSGLGPNGTYYFKDVDVKYGHQYRYQILPRHRDGRYGKKSEVRMVRVE